MVFDRPWRKHGLGGLPFFCEPKTILRFAFALPNKRQYDPETESFLDASARMRFVAKM